MSLGDYESILTEIAEEWGIAEEEIKLAEQIHLKVVFPAIKELRYAGRRLADALAAISRNEPKEQILDYLADARFGCHCARHDVIDASILRIAVVLELMLDKLGDEAVLAAFPDYPHLLASVQETQSAIAGARKKREDRRDIYQELQEAKFPALVQEFNRLKASEPLMKRIAARTKLQRNISYAIGVGGLILALIALF